MKYDLENEKLFDRALNVNQIEYSNKLKIYLSGAISNKDIKEAKKEFSDAERKIKKDLKALKIDKNYCEIINPFRVLKINKKYKYEDYLKADIIELINCDIVVDIKNAGYKKSKGRKLEINIARALKIKVYCIFNFLQMFYKDYIKELENQNKKKKLK